MYKHLVILSGGVSLENSLHSTDRAHLDTDVHLDDLNPPDNTKPPEVSPE